MIIIGVATCPRKCNTRGSRTTKNFDFQPTTPRQLRTQLQFNFYILLEAVSENCLKMLEFQNIVNEAQFLSKIQKLL